MSAVTEVQHLRAEVARLEAALADATAPRTPPSHVRRAGRPCGRSDGPGAVLTEAGVQLDDERVGSAA